MQPVDDFRLAAHDGPYEGWPLRTPLLRASGERTGLSVPGYVLRHQLRVGEEWLLVTDWDCPFEEATEVLLIDARPRIIARRRFGAPYASWLLDEIVVVDATTLQLRFSGGPTVELRVDPPAPWWSPRRWRSRLRAREA